MAKVYQVEKADPTCKGHIIEDVEIRIHKSILFDDISDPKAIFKADAEDLFNALRSLPGGTFDQLLILMLQKCATSFVVPHKFHDEKAAHSMLALLEKLLPTIEEEAERRASFPAYDDEEGEYWTEMRGAAAEIAVEIDRAYGRKGKSDG